MSPPRKRPRKRPRSSSLDEDESTEYKLALLSSLHPASAPSTLLELLLSCSGSVAAVTALLNRPPRTASTCTQSSLARFIPGASPTPRPPKKGSTLNLYNLAHISALTPTSLYTSFFAPDTANNLLRELLVEAETFPPPQRFMLFDRAVVSPHTTCFFLRDGDTRAVYSYQGGALPETRGFTPSMGAATEEVERKVNEVLRSRGRESGEMRGEWRVNAAFVNCYRGGGQSVGWHTDQLTYLGPKAAIASISLGCTREFRVRRIVKEGGEEGEEGEGDEKGENETENGNEGTYALWLPHNSLLLMHPGMQETWKHSIHPATALDLHPISGNTRINITYRCYRESLRPEFTPRCKCGEATILRAVKEKYFWVCAQEYALGRVSCGFWGEALFDEFGEPPWSGEFVGEGGEEPEEGGEQSPAVETLPERDGITSTTNTPRAETQHPITNQAPSSPTEYGSFSLEEYLQDVDEDIVS